MKVELDAKEQKQLQDAINKNTVSKWLKARDSMKFKVGEVLIKRTKDYDVNDTWAYEEYRNSSLRTRFLVIANDVDTKASFVRQYKIDGSLEEEVLCTFDFSNMSYNAIDQYEVDPEYIDCILLGEEYDVLKILEKERNRKDEVLSKRKSMGKVFNTLSSLNDFLLTFKKGDFIYYHDDDTSDWSDDCRNSFSVDKITSKPIKFFTSAIKNKGQIDSLRSWQKLSMNKSKSMIYIKTPRPFTKSVPSINLLGKVIYPSRPPGFNDRER